MASWVNKWEAVFVNRTILVIGHPFAQVASGGSNFKVMYGNAGPASPQHWKYLTDASHEASLTMAAELWPPFSKARQVLLLRKGSLPLLNTRRWFPLRDFVLDLVEHAHVDLVVAAWGPQGKAIVADLACRGVQAIDIGRVLWSIHGRNMLRESRRDRQEDNMP